MVHPNVLEMAGFDSRNIQDLPLVWARAYCDVEIRH